MIKVISYGKKNGRTTAQIVEHRNDKSFTRHLHHVSGNNFVDKLGRRFALPE